jgi:hypothetical protein
VVEPVSQVVRAAAPVVEPVSQVVRAAVPVVEPVVRSVEPVLEPISQVVHAAAPLVEPVSQMVEAVAPIIRPVVQTVVRSVAPVLDPVLATVSPVADSIGAAVEPVTDLLSPVTKPIGDTLTPVVEPIVAPGNESAEPSTPDPSAEPPVLPARQAKAAPSHQETVPAALQTTARLTAPDRTYDRPSPTPGPIAAKPRQAHPARQAAPAQPVRTPGNAPMPQSPAPGDAACGPAPTIPPAFLTPDHGPRATHAFTPSDGDFVPLWRACEPGTSPG